MAETCSVWKVATETGKLPDGCESSLKVRALSSMRHFIDFSLKVPAGLPPLPRVGVTFTIPRECANVTWYGLGPWENYPDRESGAKLAIHRAKVGLASGLKAEDGTLGLADDRLNPDNYVLPAEQGRRGGTRWVEFAGGGRKLRLSAINRPFGFNAWPYPMSALEKATHQEELVSADEITVVVDAAMMGVGGDNSWSKPPHDDVLPGAGEYHLQLVVEEFK